MTFFSTPSSPIQAMQPIPGKWSMHSFSCNASPVYYENRQSNIAVAIEAADVEEIWTFPVPSLLVNGQRSQSRSLYMNPLLLEDPVPLGLLMNGDNDITPRILMDMPSDFSPGIDYFQSLPSFECVDLKTVVQDESVVLVMAGPKGKLRMAKRTLLESYKLYFASQSIILPSDIALNDSVRASVVSSISSYLDNQLISYDWKYDADGIPLCMLTLYGFSTTLQTAVLPAIQKIVMEAQGFQVGRHVLANRAAVLTCFPELMYLDKQCSGSKVPPRYLVDLLRSTLSNSPELDKIIQQTADPCSSRILLPPRVRQFHTAEDYRAQKDSLDFFIASKDQNNILNDLAAVSSADVKVKSCYVNQMKLQRFLDENPYLIETLCQIYHITADVIWTNKSGLVDMLCCQLVLQYRSEAYLLKFLREFSMIYSQFQSFSLLFPHQPMSTDMASNMASGLAGISQSLSLDVCCTSVTYEELLAAGIVDGYAEKPACTDLLRVSFTGHLSNIVQFLSCPDLGFMTMGGHMVLPLHLSFQWSVSSEAQDFICGKKNGKLIKIMKNTGSYIHFSEKHAAEDLFADIYLSYTIAPMGNLSQVDSFLIPHICRIFGYLREAIEQILGELPATSTFYIPEVYHKKIIGHGGKNIQKLMKSLGVYVKFMNASELASHEDFLAADGRSLSLLKGMLTAYYTPNVIVKTPSKNWVALVQMKSLLLEMCEEIDKTRTSIVSFEMDGSCEHSWDLLYQHPSVLGSFSAFLFPSHHFKPLGGDVVMLTVLDPDRRDIETCFRNSFMVQDCAAFHAQSRVAMDLTLTRKQFHPLTIVDVHDTNRSRIFLLGSRPCLDKYRKLLEMEIAKFAVWSSFKPIFPEDSSARHQISSKQTREHEISKDNLDEFLKHFPCTLLPPGTRLGSYRQVRKASFAGQKNGQQSPVGIIGDKKTPLSAPGSPRLGLRTFQIIAAASDISSAFADLPPFTFDSDEILKDIHHTSQLNENIVIESIQTWKTPLLSEQILERPHSPEAAI